MFPLHDPVQIRQLVNDRHAELRRSASASRLRREVRKSRRDRRLRDPSR